MGRAPDKKKKNLIVEVWVYYVIHFPPFLISSSSLSLVEFRPLGIGTFTSSMAHHT